MALRTISWGVGVQSTALVILAGTGQIDFPTALFANVGDDSEHPDTLAYFHDHAKPWAEGHGVTVHELRHTYADGRPHLSLLEYMTRVGSRSVPIPMRQSRTGAPASRTCTVKWKAETLSRWRRDQGATADDPAIAAIGFSTDEIERVNSNKHAAWERLEFPLLTLGLNRNNCETIIRDAGLPPAPKSACWFCPWTRVSRWSEVRRDDPERFEKSADLEEYLSDRSIYFGHGALTLSDTRRPLRSSIPEAQTALFDMDGPEGCDEGHCWT